MKAPKNIAKYESSLVAGMKLMQLVLEKVLGCKDGVKVRWSITVSYWNDDWADKEKLAATGAVVVPESATFSNL